MLDEFDKQIIIKCYKEKKGNRTYVIGLYNYFEFKICEKYCKSLQKFLATSMTITEEKGKGEEEEREREDKLENKKKEKKEDKEKTYNKPIYSFRGNHIIKIKEHLIQYAKIPENEIKE